MKNLFWLLGFVFLLSSCAHPPKYTPLTTPWPERQQQLLALTEWQFRGHVIFKMPEQHGDVASVSEHKFSANVSWQQNADAYKVMLFGPLGFSAVNLDGRPGAVHLKDSHGKVYEADNPESLMQTQLGWSLPISSLYYWVRGLPSPEPITSVTYDAYHRIAHLQQQGWRIDYMAYQRVQQLELPQEITFMQDKYYMHLTIEGDSWQVNR